MKSSVACACAEYSSWWLIDFSRFPQHFVYNVKCKQKFDTRIFGWADFRVYHTAYEGTYHNSCNIQHGPPITHLKRDEKENFHSIIFNKKSQKIFSCHKQYKQRESNMSATWRQRNMPMWHNDYLSRRRSRCVSKLR